MNYYIKAFHFRRSNQSVLKEINLEYSLKGLLLNWSSNTLAPWCEEQTHWKRPWCWERLRAGEEGDRGWDGWMAPLTERIWVWANSGRWWRTGKPGVLQSMGSQRVRHDWATEQLLFQQQHTLFLYLKTKQNNHLPWSPIENDYMLLTKPWRWKESFVVKGRPPQTVTTGVQDVAPQSLQLRFVDHFAKQQIQLERPLNPLMCLKTDPLKEDPPKDDPPEEAHLS